MNEMLQSIDLPPYTQAEINEVWWGVRGLVEKMSYPYFADRNIRRGHPDYQYNKFITNWFTGLFGYAEMILPLCRDAEKYDDWQERINAIKTPMQELHEGTPPDNTEEMLEEAENIAKEMITYFRGELPITQATLAA